MKTLVLGGTRFVGKALVRLISAKNHEITIFTRGNRSAPPNVEHLRGDRNSPEDLELLRGRSFDVIVDVSGRTLLDTQSVLAVTGAPSQRFLYVSSAGVYANSELWPVDESFKVDSNSRHIGKFETETWLANSEIPFTSFRPTYIYGPGNYNPIETWFFDRIMNNRPVPIPGNGSYITQLGHVYDLAEAMVHSLEFRIATNKIYNCSNKQGVTFLGLVETAAKVCGKNMDQIETRSFNPSGLDPKSRKAFPLRIGHFLTDTSRISNDLDWAPNFDLEKGLLDSFKNDYLVNKSNEIDFSLDEKLISC